jgi:hypothetical protein
MTRAARCRTGSCRNDGQTTVKKMLRLGRIARIGHQFDPSLILMIRKHLKRRPITERHG